MANRIHLKIVRSLAHTETCNEPWEHVRGKTIRHCDHCEREVHSLSALTASQAVGLLTLHNGTLCMRIERRVDGTPVTRDRERGPSATAALAAVALALCPTEVVAQDARPAFTTVDAGMSVVPDSDHDAIADDRDACPMRPGTADTDALRNGCPRVVVVSSGVINISSSVNFPVMSAVPSRPSVDVLQAVVEVLRGHAEIRRIRATGHTTRGEATGIGLRRAQAVRIWLIAHGVAPDRIEVADAAATRPIDSARNPTGGVFHRRHVAPTRKCCEHIATIHITGLKKAAIAYVGGFAHSDTHVDTPDWSPLRLVAHGVMRRDAIQPSLLAPLSQEQQVSITLAERCIGDFFGGVQRGLLTAFRPVLYR
jgi:outer membrane protein OmpA-like peptidoglycan-associated protein